MSCKEKLCKNCLRWYTTHVDQCELPVKYVDDFSTAVYGEDSSKEERYKFKFVQSRQINVNRSDNKAIFGHPSKLNVNHDCIFYIDLPKDMRFLTQLVRYFI